MKPPLSTPKYALSFVIPLYQSAGPIRTVVKELERLLVDGGHEIILVNDGSPDATASVCRELIREALVPMIYVQHARNFGEHNAVLTGWRYAQGEWIVNLDDDGQNPPAEALRLFQHAKTTELDVIYGDYASKQHAAWRNVGSRFTNWITDRLLDKPAGFYLSSFRCVRGSIAREAARYDGPFPYIDGLLLQITQNIGSIEVQHKARADGQSSYTLKKLLRLWLSTVVNFSVLPLRIASIIGSLLALGGLLGIVLVLYWRMTNQGPAFGWGSLMAALLLFSGVQLLMLGVIGEYLGRMFLTINRRPQAVVREVIKSDR